MQRLLMLLLNPTWLPPLHPAAVLLMRGLDLLGLLLLLLLLLAS